PGCVRFVAIPVIPPIRISISPTRCRGVCVKRLPSSLSCLAHAPLTSGILGSNSHGRLGQLHLCSHVLQLCRLLMYDCSQSLHFGFQSDDCSFLFLNLAILFFSFCVFFK